MNKKHKHMLVFTLYACLHVTCHKSRVQGLPKSMANEKRMEKL